MAQCSVGSTGNLTSQFWANVYLNGLDHMVKRRLACKGYVRYVDDLLLFADDRPTLHAWRAEVIDHAAALRLTVHEQSAQPAALCHRCAVPGLPGAS